VKKRGGKSVSQITKNKLPQSLREGEIVKKVTMKHLQENHWRGVRKTSWEIGNGRRNKKISITRQIRKAKKRAERRRLNLVVQNVGVSFPFTKRRGEGEEKHEIRKKRTRRRGRGKRMYNRSDKTDTPSKKRGVHNHDWFAHRRSGRARQG